MRDSYAHLHKFNQWMAKLAVRKTMPKVRLDLSLSCQSPL
jgi:hypothetical protein